MDPEILQPRDFSFVMVFVILLVLLVVVYIIGYKNMLSNETSLNFREEHELPELLSASVIASSDLSEVHVIGVVGSFVGVDVLVNVLFIDREVSEGQDFGVEFHTFTAGTNVSLDVIAINKSDVVDLNRGVSSGLVGSECSGVATIFGVGDLVNAGSVLD